MVVWTLTHTSVCMHKLCVGNATLMKSKSREQFAWMHNSVLKSFSKRCRGRN